MKKFDNLIIIGRPACGKSEFIDFMKNQVGDGERLQKFHIAPFVEADDFVWLWEKCAEDDIWEGLGEERLVSKKSGHAYFITNPKFWDFLIEKFSPEIEKRFISDPEFYKGNTLFIEFSRGGEEAYKNALRRLSPPVMERAAILYIKVSFEESCRRNDARYREKLKHSVLAHKVPDEEMHGYYRTDDWDYLTGGGDAGCLLIDKISVPFVTMNNEPESREKDILEGRYGAALAKLMELYQKRV